MNKGTDEKWLAAGKLMLTDGFNSLSNLVISLSR